MSADSRWFVYILECDSRYLYTGITTDISRRMGEHRQGPPLGAKFMKKVHSFELVYSVEVESRSLASKIESRIKQLSRTEKKQIISGKFSLENLIQFLKI
jgi:putative endonuclease